MSKTIILETERLSLREFTLQDTAFIIALVNTPSWLEFIGERNVKTTQDAQRFITENLMKSYTTHGYGLWLVALKDTQVPIGMCGLVNRDTLEDIDIGFALLPEYASKGYGFEMAVATLKHAKHTLGIHKVIAITDPKNVASIALLHKIGLQYEKTMQLSDYDTVSLFSPIEK